MRFVRTYVPTFLSLLPAFPLFSQQTPTTVTRDQQALALAQQSVTAMASTTPTDSSASGSITIVEGSTTQNGSIQILTLGTAQTSETLTLPSGKRAIVYSNGDPRETNGSQSIIPPLELSSAY